MSGFLCKLIVSDTKGTQREGSQLRQTRDRTVQQQSQETSTMTSNTATGPKTVTASVGTQNNITSQVLTQFHNTFEMCCAIKKLLF